MEVLEKTGVVFDHEKALKLFEKNGYKVDYTNRTVCFPSQLLMEWLNKVPDEWSFKRRGPKNDLTVGGETVYFASACGMGAVDLDTWQSRPPTRKEAYEAERILDAIQSLS